jgi:NADH-quinone oxidoreductase subunit N
LPFLLVTAAALKLLMLTALMRRRIATSLATWTAVVAGLAVLGTTLVQWYELDRYGSSVTAAGAIVYDPFGVLMTAGIAVSLILAVLNGHDWQRREGIVGAEYQMLVLLAAGGAILMAQANDLIIVFLGLEILSIALYCLIAFNRRRQASAESAMKYFLLGGFAAAIFIYGVALTYGATGTTNLTNIAYFLGSNHLLHPGLLLAGGGLMLVAFVFKVEAAPFHFWAPDVYEGEPTPLSGAHASIVWAGAFAALVRIMVVALGSQQSTWRPLFFGLIVASIATGALLTIQQSNAKRLLAYASVTQSGFVLLGIWAGTASGVAATTFYVVTYGPVVLANFAIVTCSPVLPWYRQFPPESSDRFRKTPVG